MKKDIYTQLENRIMLLDGGFGTMVQQYGLVEEDYRGERFAEWPMQLKGCNDLLTLTRPQIVEEIHEKYLEAGADIIETNTFNTNAVSLSDYRLEGYVYEISRAAAELARAAADRYTLRDAGKPRFVAGSVGPTNRTSSFSADVNDPAAREITFMQLKEAYTEQIRGLLDGGADIILIETVFDTLNAKAALYAADILSCEYGRRIPIMISGTLADSSGRTLSGQVIEAFYASVSHADLLSVGFNCAYGAKQLRPYLERLAAISEFRISAHPNAGLPNIMGGYDETPQMFARDVSEYMRMGLVNIVGGCCGTTPEHIYELSKIADRYEPRPLPARSHTLTLSNLEPLKITPESNFINIGERTNVAGSAKFARLIREGAYEEALSIARAQVESGAQIVDVCMDDGMIDGTEAMRRFLNLMASEPEIARVPVMIDSSKWEILQTGLQVTQGKSIVNSISLKEGEEKFLERAAEIHRYGAAAVVMLFDERGQADTFERKCEVAERSYRILTENGFPAEDIIFDPNILAVGTGIPEHDTYAKAFIDATRWIKEHLPYAKVSGGVSNLSFAFRGNNTVREAMHSVFLYHAIGAGMDMAIVNPQMLQIYTQIEPELLERAEDLILCRREDAAERLSEYAQSIRPDSSAKSTIQTVEWRTLPLAERIEYALMKGVTDHIAEDTLEACRTVGSPMGVIDKMLMPAMDKVGELFGSGRMFLPQVVKSARVMKSAVSVLTPYIEQGAGGSTAGKVLIATVKGDVHDIGKNIVAVVAACNGFDVSDLGVMVESGRIADEAQSIGADAVMLSGLITPSLDEMIRVCEEFERRGLRIPIIIGGATTSPMHTAVKIAPAYSGVVIHSPDASSNSRILSDLASDRREEYIRSVMREQEKLREDYLRAEQLRETVKLSEARKYRIEKPQSAVAVPRKTGSFVLNGRCTVADIEAYIDWTYFFHSWEINGRYPEVLENEKYGSEARRLLEDARRLLDRIKREELLKLEGVVGIYRCKSLQDDIIVTDETGREHILPMLRSQSRKTGCKSLSDYVSPTGDYIGLFALTAGTGLQALMDSCRAEGDEYTAIMAKLLSDRLAEAFAEAVHRAVRRELWGYETGPEQTPDELLRGQYEGIRVGFGYPSSPDHTLKREVFAILQAEARTSMRLTDNCMINPGESLCGMMFRESEYITVGRIDEEQIADYAARRGVTPEEIIRIIPKNV